MDRELTAIADDDLGRLVKLLDLTRDAYALVGVGSFRRLREAVPVGAPDDHAEELPRIRLLEIEEGGLAARGLGVLGARDEAADRGLLVEVLCRFGAGAPRPSGVVRRPCRPPPPPRREQEPPRTTQSLHRS